MLHHGRAGLAGRAVRCGRRAGGRGGRSSALRRARLGAGAGAGLLGDIVEDLRAERHETSLGGVTKVYHAIQTTGDGASQCHRATSKTATTKITTHNTLRIAVAHGSLSLPRGRARSRQAGRCGKSWTNGTPQEPVDTPSCRARDGTATGKMQARYIVTFAVQVAVIASARFPLPPLAHRRADQGMTLPSPIWEDAAE